MSTGEVTRVYGYELTTCATAIIKSNEVSMNQVLIHPYLFDLSLSACREFSFGHAILLILIDESKEECKVLALAMGFILHDRMVYPVITFASELTRCIDTPSSRLRAMTYGRSTVRQ